MIRSAAGADRVFLDRTQPGERLADVDDARLRAAHGLDDAGRGRGDAAHVAEEVERDALRREQAARGTLERRDRLAGVPASDIFIQNPSVAGSAQEVSVELPEGMYADSEIVSNISSLFLRPTPYSQI